MNERHLTCPACGRDERVPGLHGQGFLYLEEVTNVRPVHGFNAEGVLEIEGRDHLDIDDGGANHRLQCRACLTEFELPDDIPLDFVS